MRRALLCALVLSALAAPAAWARDPIVPLSQIHRGLHCTARTVVQGTDVSTFDVDVLDVVADSDGTGARILVRVSGPAVDQSGIAEGFSGSPVYCPDANGNVGNAGAISATIGEYGEHVGLVTPIEQMLSLPVTPPSGVRKAPRLLRAARAVASPLVVSGLSTQLGQQLQRAALAQGHVLVAAPAGPLGSFPQQDLVPGASMATSFSTGAVSVGAIGTVTYRDGNVVYGFGHPLDAAGRRALLLQDAYVYTVVDNPLDTSQSTSYKLAAPGHTVGTLTNDALTGVVGALGAAPDTVPLTVRVKDDDTGAFTEQRTNLVDETDLGDPNGQGAVPGIAAVAVAQGVTTAFDGSPAQETGVLCLTARLRELPLPLRVCNRYVVQGALAQDEPIPLALSMGGDVSAALSAIGSARFRALHLTSLDASVRISRGMALATIRSADVSRHVVRPGQRIRVALRVRLLRGPLRTVRFTLTVPHGLSPGFHTLRLVGTPVGGAGSAGGGLAQLLAALFGIGGDSAGAQSMPAVIAQYLSVERWDGVRAALGRHTWRAVRSPQVRIDGRASVDLIVAKPGRHRRRPARPRAIGRILNAALAGGQPASGRPQP